MAEVAPWMTGTIAFEPADPPRAGMIMVGPARDPLALAKVWRDLLSADVEGPELDQTSRFWGAVTAFGLNLVARARVLPTVTPSGADAWRVGVLDPADLAHLRRLTRAMPTELRIAGETPSSHDQLVREFLDAIADLVIRAASGRAPHPEFAGKGSADASQHRTWTEALAARLDPSIRVSFRVDLVEQAGSAELKLITQVHDRDQPATLRDAAALWLAEAARQRRLELVLALRQLADLWPPIERLLDQAVPGEIPLEDEDLASLDAAELSRHGVELFWPDRLVTDLQPRMIISADQTTGPGAGIGDTRFDWELQLDGTRLTADEIATITDAHRPIVRLRGQWLLIDAETTEKLRKRGGKLKPFEALTAVLAGRMAIAGGDSVDVVATGWLDSVRAQLAAEPAMPVIDQPGALKAQLREYQLLGVQWMVRLTSLGLGVCLADDMGLGKTISLIALHLHRRELTGQQRTLIVCPASLLGNWEREIGRFAPDVEVRRFHGPKRELADFDQGIVLTTYATMRLDAETLAAGDRGWDLFVLDEAQHVKNPRSSTARAARAIPATARIALTGTPVENNLTDLWAIMDWATPGLLGTLGQFNSRWATPIESDRDPVLAAAFARMIKPFLLRRRKSDPHIAPELPPKTVTDHPVELTTEQIGLYRATIDETFRRIAASTGIQRRGLIMKLLTSCKQICNHPAQYLKEQGPVIGNRSGKIELLDELVDTIRAEDGAVLVFTQYVAMAKIMAAHFAQREIPAQLLDGSTPVKRREELVHHFQTVPQDEVPVFLLSLKAAGTGLNLPRADHVIHFDRWWNPAVEEQASDRAYRIGQTRPVQIHRLIAEGTVEDKIASLLDSKRDLADSVLTSGESAISELTNEDLANLFALNPVGG